MHLMGWWLALAFGWLALAWAATIDLGPRPNDGAAVAWERCWTLNGVPRMDGWTGQMTGCDFAEGARSARR